MPRNALILLHFQRDICLPGGLMAPSDPAALARIAEAADQASLLARAAREAGVPVVHIAFGMPAGGSFANRTGRLFRWITEVGGCIEGSEGHGFIPALSPASGDEVLRGNGTSGFTGSGLAVRLAEWGSERVFLAGITTHWAVESTAREASERGLEVAVVSDACASANASTHAQALERLSFIAQVIEAAEVAAALGTASGK